MEKHVRMKIRMDFARQSSEQKTTVVNSSAHAHPYTLFRGQIDFAFQWYNFNWTSTFATESVHRDDLFSHKQCLKFLKHRYNGISPFKGLPVWFWLTWEAIGRSDWFGAQENICLLLAPAVNSPSTACRPKLWSICALHFGTLLQFCTHVMLSH